MRMESHGDISKALSLYNELLKEDPGRVEVWKRKVTIYKTEGKHIEMMRELNEYLKFFPSDVEAWQEQAQGYIAIGR